MKKERAIAAGVLVIDFYRTCSEADAHVIVEGRGTMVAGVLSAVAGTNHGIDGASHNALIMPIRVSDGGDASYASMKDALAFVKNLETPPAVVNMSVGGYAAGGDEDDLDDLADLVDGLRDDLDVVVVASAGNDGSSADHYPSCLDGVISVSSVGLSGMASNFSNYHETVDLCALGEGIYTTVNPHARGDGLLYSDTWPVYTSLGGLEFQKLHGSSFSAPQVAAAAALLRAQDPSLSADGVESRLKSTATRVTAAASSEDLDGDYRPDSQEYGAGGWTRLPLWAARQARSPTGSSARASSIKMHFDEVGEDERRDLVNNGGDEMVAALVEKYGEDVVHAYEQAG